MTPRPIVLDCDPGHDDAIAMLLAHGSPAIDLRAVTTVFGNQTVQKVTRNAVAVARVAGMRGVPIARGADRPLVRPVSHAASIHGESGMDGPALPPVDEEALAARLDPRHAVDTIIDTVMDSDPGEVTLVPTGALTNIALAARKEPRIVPRVREVVLMGGAVSGGNWSAAAEFNIVVDPESARIVFDEAWPVTMVGLDLTHQALATDAVRQRIAGVGTAPAGFVDDLLDFFAGSYRQVQGFEHPPVHDPCAVAHVIDPEAVRTRRAPVSVECAGELTTGMTVADLRSPAPPDCRTSVATDLDHTRFWDLVVDALERIGDPRPA